MQQALAEAKISPQDISVIAFTKVRQQAQLRSMVSDAAPHIHKQQRAPACLLASGLEHETHGVASIFCCQAPLLYGPDACKVLISLLLCAGARDGRSTRVVCCGRPHAVAGEQPVQQIS